MFKRICSLLLAMIMVIGLLPMAVFADEVDNTTVVTEPAPTETEPVPTETEPVPTETEPVPTETEPVPTETEPVPTETEPVPTETEPVPTETEPVPTETEPVPTETEPVPTEDPLAEAKATLEAMIAALPTPEEVAAMSDAEKEAFYNEKLLPIYTFAMENGLSLDENVTWNQVNVALAGGLDTGDEAEWDRETIATVDDLKAFAAAVNADDNFAGETVKLTANIDLTGVEWTPLTSFAGTFDGQNYTISNLTNAAGLFNTVTSEGTVQNLKLDKVTADFASNVAYGFLALTVEGKVTNCHISNVTVDRAGNSNAKGGAFIKSVIGDAVVENCTATNITVTHAANSANTDCVDGLGGVFGGASGNAVIKNCSGSNITMTFANKTKRVGGFIEGVSGNAKVENCTLTVFTIGAKEGDGYLQEVGGFAATISGGTVTDCTVEDASLLTARVSRQTGGFVGQFTGGTIDGCKVIDATIDVATRGSNTIGSTAGFCGQTNGDNVKTFIDCSVTGLDMTITGGLETGIGGFLTSPGGNGAVNITGCSVEGEINATGNTNAQPVGGFLGNLGWGGEAHVTISNSNADVTIAAPETAPVGSFVGKAESSNTNASLEIQDCTTGTGEEKKEVTTENGIGTGSQVEVVVPVAEVNGTSYGSLPEAVNAANGGTITLLSDVEITAETTFTMAEGTVLDLNGKTIKGDDGKAIFTGANFTIKNGTITGFNGKDYYPITIDGGSAILEGLTFVSGGVKIRNSAVVTLRDNAITANQSDFKYAVWAYGSANVTIESGTYFGGKNGYDVFAEGGAKLTLYGGTYKVTNNKTYMAKNAELVYFKNADGTYTVKVDGIYTYADLVAAIAEANNGDVLELKADIAAEGQVVINKSLTLNLGEFTITGSTDEAVLRAYSAVADTVIDVTINATTGGIVNKGAGYAIYAGEDIADGNDEERTNLTINGGTYESAGTDCIRQIMGLCTINGGSYKSSYGRTVLNGKRWYGAEFKINDGTFYEFNPACVSVWTGFEGNNWDNFYHQHDIIAEGKTATYDDGWYTVVDGTYAAVAQTKSLCYPSVEAALKASIHLNDVANLGTITLLADDTLDLDGATIELPEGLTIDLNGHTLTVPFQKTLFAGNNITICNGTITTGSTENYGLYIMSGSFTLENLTCTNGINVQGGNVTLKDVNATCPNKYYAVYAGANADVTILSGNYKTVRNEKNLYADGKITVYGGTFSKDPSDYVAEGYNVCKNGSNFVVCKLVMTYEELVAAVESNSVVKLGADITAPKTVVINKSLTLDLGEFTITGNTDEAVLRAYSAVADTVIDVTINATTGGIKNSGTGYAIYAGEDLDGGNDAERTNLTVNGGNYESAGTDCIRQIVGLCTINGGSYKSSYGRTVLNGKQWYGAEFKINGGTFYEFNPACVSVWTGFNGKDYTNFYHQHDIIADGKTAEYKDGWYTVVDGTYTAVAETKSMCYPSVEAALKASINLNDVANLGTITLLANDTLDLNKETITLPKGLVIDLNGKTLTVPFQKTLFAGENITIKNGTITTGGKESYGLYIMSGSFTLEDVTCTNGISVQAAEVILKDCDVTNPNSRYYAVYAGDNADVTILSGTYQNPYNTRNHPVLYGSITVYGGSFSKTSPNAFVAEGEDLHVVKSGSWYTVYEGFQNALNAAKAGDTAYLLSNIEVAETIKIDKNLTLDLGESTITSTAKVGVYANGGNLTINGTTGGIVVAGTVAVGQDNGVCTINGGSFRADGDTSDVANGNPVKYRYTLDNSNTTQDGITGSFVINGGKFYGFNPACMFINPDDGHDHDSISAGKVAVLDENGWFTVAEGTLTHTIVCECDYPAPSHQYCFTSEDQATLFISLFTSCEHDKIVKIAE